MVGDWGSAGGVKGNSGGRGGGARAACMRQTAMGNVGVGVWGVFSGILYSVRVELVGGDSWAFCRGCYSDSGFGIQVLTIVQVLTCVCMGSGG